MDGIKILATKYIELVDLLEKCKELDETGQAQINTIIMGLVNEIKIVNTRIRRKL